MRRIWLLAWNDVRLTSRDRAAFIWMLVMPLAMMWFFGGMGGGGASDPRIALTVVDHDGGWLAEALLEEIDVERITLRRMTSEQAQAEENKIRTLVIPEGFTVGALAGEQQTLLLEAEPGADAQFGTAAQVQILRAVARSIARLAEMETPDPETFRELGRRERLVRLDVRSAGKGRVVPNGLAQSVPGNLTFVVMMMTLIYGGVFLTLEKRSGLLRRQASLPLSRGELFAAKLLGRLLLASMQIGLLLLAGRFLFDLSFGRSVAGLLLLMAGYAIAVAGLSTLLGAVLSTPDQASGVGWIVGMVLAALGGCWWPGEITPPWMQAVAHALPTAWAMDGFHALISFGHGLDAVLVPSLVLLAFGLFFSLLGARYFRFD